MLRAAHVPRLWEPVDQPGRLYVPLQTGPQMAGGGEGLSDMTRRICSACSVRPARPGGYVCHRCIGLYFSAHPGRLIALAWLLFRLTIDSWRRAGK